MATDMTAGQAEKYVRERWLSRTIVEQQADEFGKLSLWKMNDTLYATEADAWLAASEYTRAHEQKIAELREEIDFLDFAFSVQDRDEDRAIVARILAREQAALDELLLGWRQK